MKKKDLYVLNEFIIKDRKIYGLKGISFGRPIRLKSVSYFLAIFFAMMILRAIPILGYPIRQLVPIMYFMIPAILSYLLTDLNTESRSPIQCAKSMILYYIRKLKSKSYYRGKTLDRQRSYKFHSFLEGGYLTYKEKDGGSNLNDKV